MTIRRQERWVMIGIALGSLAYYLAYAHTFLNMPSLNDEGLAFYGGLRVMQGQRPLADFWAYPPGRYWLLAGVLHVFGTHLFAERALLAVLLAVKNGLAYGVARQVMPRGWALAATLTIALVPGPWHKVYYALLMFAQLAVLLAYLKQPNAWRAAGCGLAAGVAFYFRQDSAAYGLVACAVMVSAAMWGPPETRDLRRWLAHGLIIAGVFVACLLPLLVMYAGELDVVLRRLGSDPVMVAEVIYERIHFLSFGRLGKFFISHITDGPSRLFLKGFFPWVSMAIGGVALGTVLFGGMRSALKRPGAGTLAWAAVVVWTMLSLMKVYKQPNMEAVLMAGQGAVLLGAVMGRWLWGWCCRSGGGGGRWVVGVAAWSVGGFAWVNLILLAAIPIEKIESGTWPHHRGPTERLVVERASMVLPQQQAMNLERLIFQVQQRTTPKQTIYAWQQPMLYVLTQRDNAILTDSIVPPIVLKDWQDHMMDVFTHRPPALQIIDTRGGWLKRLRAYPEPLQQAMFAGYRVTLTIDEYLLLEHTGEGNAYEAMMQLAD